MSGTSSNEQCSLQQTIQSLWYFELRESSKWLKIILQRLVTG